MAHGFSDGSNYDAAWRTAAAWLASGVSGTYAFLLPFGAGASSVSTYSSASGAASSACGSSAAGASA